jgi:hypothetical protein
MLVRSPCPASGLFLALLSCATYQGLGVTTSTDGTGGAFDGSAEAFAPDVEAGGAGDAHEDAEAASPEDAAPPDAADDAAAARADSEASTKCLPVASQGLITDFHKPCAVADGGASNNACFGVYGSTASGGTFDPYPPPLLGGDSQADSGSACVWYGTKTAVYGDARSGAWVLSGTVGTWAGAGIWIAPCVNASGYSGIQFTVSGDAGPTGRMTFKVASIDDFWILTSGGKCTANCAPGAAPFTVTTTPTVVTFRWEDLVGGSPVPAIDSSQVVQLQWEFDWPCTGATPFPVNVTIDDVKLVP